MRLNKIKKKILAALPKTAKAAKAAQSQELELLLREMNHASKFYSLLKEGW